MRILEGDELEAYLLPEDVAGAVEWVLAQREGVIATDVTLETAASPD